MPFPHLRPFVAEHLAAAGHVTSTSAPLHVTGPVLDVVVDEQDGTLAVWDLDDDLRPQQVRLLTRDPHVLETYLVVATATAWRRRHRLRPLPDAKLRPPRAHRVERTDDGGSAVVRADGTVVAWRLPAATAHRLAAALEHPVQVVVAAVQEKAGRPVWTGSTTAPALRSLLLAVVTVAVVGWIQLSRHVGSPEFAIGATGGLVLCLVGGLWLAGAPLLARRATRRALDAARPGSPRWRCLAGPRFQEATPAPGRWSRWRDGYQTEVTLVEAPTGLEVWRGGAPDPLLHVPWDEVASVDAEPLHAGQTADLVVRTTAGARYPLGMLRDPEGGLRPATAAATEQHAAHLRARVAARGA